MIKNADGTFTIKNSQTGETKTVGASELPQYGLSPTGAGQPDYAGAVSAKVAQPGAELSQTQTGTAATAASIPGTQAKSQVESATVLPQITQITADAVKAKNDQDKINAISDAGALFEKNKGADNKVSPNDYNSQLSKYVALGGTADDFNARFQNKYVNPNNIYYDTPDNINVRKSLSLLSLVIHSYADADQAGQTGPIVNKMINAPGFGVILGQKFFPKAISHDKFKNEVAAKILPLAGAGQGSTVRGTMAELLNAVSLLPNSSDSKDTANENVGHINQLLEKAYGTNLSEWGL